MTVLDAACLVALFRGEPGADAVGELIRAGAVLSAINRAETIDRLVRQGAGATDVRADLDVLELESPPVTTELADRAHMSPSTFRQHFRALTGVSPLQYQKQLRLQEARQLMLNEHLDAGTAAGRVGYESPSQFSREYSRLFGAPPLRDVSRLRKVTKWTAA